MPKGEGLKQPYSFCKRGDPLVAQWSAEEGIFKLGLLLHYVLNTPIVLLLLPIF